MKMKPQRFRMSQIIRSNDSTEFTIEFITLLCHVLEIVNINKIKYHDELVTYFLITLIKDTH